MVSGIQISYDADSLLTLVALPPKSMFLDKHKPATSENCAFECSIRLTTEKRPHAYLSRGHDISQIVYNNGMKKQSECPLSRHEKNFLIMRAIVPSF